MHQSQSQRMIEAGQGRRYAIWVLFTKHGRLLVEKRYAQSLEAGLEAFAHAHLLMDGSAIGYIIRRARDNDTLEVGSGPMGGFEWTPVPDIHSVQVEVTYQRPLPANVIRVKREVI